MRMRAIETFFNADLVVYGLIILVQKNSTLLYGLLLFGFNNKKAPPAILLEAL